MAAFSAIDSEPPPLAEEDPIDSRHANASEDAPGRGEAAAGLGRRLEEDAGALKEDDERAGEYDRFDVLASWSNALNGEPVRELEEGSVGFEGGLVQTRSLRSSI